MKGMRMMFIASSNGRKGYFHTQSMINICVCVCVCVYTYLCMHTYLHMHIYVYVCIYVYICVCVCVCVCVCLIAPTRSHVVGTEQPAGSGLKNEKTELGV